jgi:hypothetical protein
VDFMVFDRDSLSALYDQKHKRQSEILHSVTYKRDTMYGISSFTSTEQKACNVWVMRYELQVVDASCDESIVSCLSHRDHILGHRGKGADTRKLRYICVRDRNLR